MNTTASSPLLTAAAALYRAASLVDQDRAAVDRHGRPGQAGRFGRELQDLSMGIELARGEALSAAGEQSAPLPEPSGVTVAELLAEAEAATRLVPVERHPALGPLAVLVLDLSRQAERLGYR